jgi:hypothetical protein
MRVPVLKLIWLMAACFAAVIPLLPPGALPTLPRGLPDCMLPGG